MALTLVLLCGLFLLGVSEGRPRWKELLLIFAAAELTVYPLAVGFGTYFFPAVLLGVLAWRGWALLCVLALAAYLALHRSRGFWLAWALMAGCSLAALLACWGVSALAGGYLARQAHRALQLLAAYGLEQIVQWVRAVAREGVFSAPGDEDDAVAHARVVEPLRQLQPACAFHLYVQQIEVEGVRPAGKLCAQLVGGRKPAQLRVGAQLAQNLQAVCGYLRPDVRFVLTDRDAVKCH